MIDTISGRTHFVITTVIPVQPHLKASKLRAIAVTSAKRVGPFPDVPTVAESGLPGFEALQWFGLFAPRNTPAPIRERLFSEVRKAAEIQSVASVLARKARSRGNWPQALAEFQTPRGEVGK